MRAPLRRSEGDFEFRCEDCALMGNAAWWPLGPEFWDYSKGFARCRACWKKRDVARVRSARLDADFRAKEAAYQREVYGSMTLAERRSIYAKKREYHREWMRAYRARRAA